MPKLKKKEVETYNKVVETLNLELDGREALPCIRTNIDGSTTLINCKTGEPIPPKKD